MNYSLYAESTPNPDVMKFVANKMLVQENIEVLSINESKNYPIAKALFSFPFVKSVFLSSNYIAIRKSKDVEWENIAIQLRSFISEFLNNTDQKDEIILKRTEKKEEKDEVNKKKFNSEEEEISEIINQYIKPAVESDGGSITLESFKMGIVKLNLSGACSGCPSASLTLKQGIETLLKDKLGDKIKDVIATES